MDGVPVVLVQHVVQVVRELVHGGPGQLGGDRPGDADRHDRVRPAVDEEDGYVGAAGGHARGHVRHAAARRQQGLPAEPALPRERIVQQRVDVLGMGAQRLGRVPGRDSAAPDANSASIQSSRWSGGADTMRATASCGERCASRNAASPPPE